MLQELILLALLFREFEAENLGLKTKRARNGQLLIVRGDVRTWSCTRRVRALVALPFQCACAVYCARKRNNNTSILYTIVTKINIIMHA